jgi:hypothetical protein
MLGYGIYWAIIEDLYNNDNTFPTDYESISYDLRVGIEVVKSVINDFGLFTINDVYFSSESVKRRLEQRNEKSEKAKESIKKRWGKYERITNVLRPEYERNTIKERKVKEIKGKESIETTSLPASPVVGNIEIDLESEYRLTLKETPNIVQFIKNNSPTFYEPYFDLWNCFAEKYKLPTLRSITDKRKRKLGIRLKEKGFDFVAILSKASKSDKAIELGFLTFDWIVESTGNYLKLLEGNYEARNSPNQHSAPAHNTNIEEIKKLQQEKLQQI